MNKPNLKSLINNIKSNKVNTKNIGTINEYGFNLNNKSNDKFKNQSDRILKNENQKIKECNTGSAKKLTKSPKITQFGNPVPVINSHQHSIPQQYKLNSKFAADESEFNNFDLDLKRCQESDVQKHTKKISDLPVNYSNFDTYNNDSFNEKIDAKNFLENSAKKSKTSGRHNLPKSKTKILFNKENKSATEFTEGVESKRILLSNKKKSKNKFFCEENIMLSNIENNFHHTLNQKNNTNNGSLNNPFRRPNHPISNAFQDKELTDAKYYNFNQANNNIKKSISKENISVANINFNNNTLHPNSMRVSNASAKSTISFSNNINNLNYNFINNNQIIKNEMIKNNYLIDMIKDSENDCDNNFSSKFIKMNTIDYKKNTYANNDEKFNDENSEEEQEEDYVPISKNKLIKTNKICNKESEVDLIENDSFDNENEMRKDYFYLAIEQSQRFLNAKNSPNFNYLNENKNANNNNNINSDNNKNQNAIIYECLMDKIDNKNRIETTEKNQELNKERLNSKKTLKLNTKSAEEQFKKIPVDTGNGSKTNYQQDRKQKYFFDNKTASVGIYSNRNKDSNQDISLFNLNRENASSNNTSANKIDMKNNTFAKDSGKKKENEEFQNENNNNSNNNITCKDFLKTLEIMKNYLKIEQTQFLEKQRILMQKNQQKDLEITRLKALNKTLNDQNLTLKDIIHKIFFKIKSYEAQELLREQTVEVISNQLIAENLYLRYICDNVIKSDIIDSTKDQEIIEQIHKKESTANERKITESNINNNEEVDSKSKGMHKRQKTHINLPTCSSGSVNTSIEATASIDTSRNSIMMNIETEKMNDNQNIANDVSQKSNGDLFGLTLNEFKEEKKNKKMKIRLDDDKEKYNSNTTSNNTGTHNNPGSTKNSGKQVYLFYRTPSNKDNKKIDFSFANAKAN